MVSFTATALSLLTFSLPLASSHLVLTYPGWRGDSLNTTGNVNMTMGMNGVTAVSGNSSEVLYPFGQQWAYPCGGTPLTTNRTYWPTTGGAIAFEPGWFTGHLFGLVYVNLGEGTNPINMSLPMVSPFQIAGPTNDAYPGQQVCLPQVPMPATLSPRKAGDNATIQVILAAQHGASLYSCVDITFADPGDEKIQKVTKDNCFNSTSINFNLVVTSRSLQSAASSLFQPSNLLLSVPAVAALITSLMW